MPQPIRRPRRHVYQGNAEERRLADAAGQPVIRTETLVCPLCGMETPRERVPKPIGPLGSRLMLRVQERTTYPHPSITHPPDTTPDAIAAKLNLLDDMIGHLERLKAALEAERDFHRR